MIPNSCLNLNKAFASVSVFPTVSIIQFFSFDFPPVYNVQVRCYQVLVQPAIPRKPRDRWFQFAMHHPALLHASLAIAASHWMHLGGSKSEALPVYYHHKIEAIRMVNTSLVDDESAVSDGTIAAIACLAISEVRTGFSFPFLSFVICQVCFSFCFAFADTVCFPFLLISFLCTFLLAFFFLRLSYIES